MELGICWKAHCNRVTKQSSLYVGMLLYIFFAYISLASHMVHPITAHIPAVLPPHLQQAHPKSVQLEGFSSAPIPYMKS